MSATKFVSGLTRLEPKHRTANKTASSSNEPRMAKNPFAKFVAIARTTSPSSTSALEEENHNVIDQLQSIEDAFCNSHMDVRHHLQLNKKRINGGEQHSSSLSSSSDNNNGHDQQHHHDDKNNDIEASISTSTTRHLIHKKINTRVVNWSDVTLDSVLGHGGFAWVFQVQINDEAENDDKSNEAGDDDDENDNGDSSMNDDGDQKETTTPATYALKCLNCKKMTTSEEFVIAVRDLAYETYFLGILNHENIIKLRGVSSIGIVNSYVHQEEADEDDSYRSPMGYYFIMDQLHGTIYDLLVEWRKIDRQRHQGGSILSSLFRSSNKKKRKNTNEMIIDESNKSSPSSSSSSLFSTTSIMSLQDRIKHIAVSIANGMKYIHSTNIVLRDLKLENVGYDQHGNIKIFDFGLARPVRSQIHMVLPSKLKVDKASNVEVAGSWKYMPPETILQQPRSMIRDVLATDVYSFGIVLWEIVALQFAYEKEYNSTLNKGYENKKERFFKEKVAIQGYRPSLKSIQSCSSSLRSKNAKALKQLLLDCWDTNIDIRPSFERIWLTLASEVVINDRRDSGCNSIMNSPQQEHHRGIANAIAVSESSLSKSKSSSHAASLVFSRNKHNSSNDNDSHNSSSQRTVVTIDSEYSSDSRRLRPNSNSKQNVIVPQRQQ